MNIQLNKNNIFTSPIYDCFLSLDIDKLKQVCYEIKNNDGSKERQYSSFNGWHSKVYVDRIDEFNELIDIIYNVIQTVKNELGFRKDLNLNILQYWININGNKSYHAPHIHRGFLFSAIYYINTSKDCGDLDLHTPIQNLQYHVRYAWFDNQDKIYTNYTVKPEPNKLVIFPSWLEHSVRVNKSSEDRISIAFDIGVI